MNLSFHLVENPKTLLPLLKERLPHSCFVHNQAVFSDKFKEIKFYTISEEINSNTWVLTDYFREDYGRTYCVSAPAKIFKREEKIGKEIKECFSSDKLIDWDEAYLFIALEKPVSKMIFDITVNIKGNHARVHPNHLYFMGEEDVKKLELEVSPETELKRLDPEAGSEFIASTWEYALPGSKEVIKRCIEATASAGVFVGGECASGVVILGDGQVHCLYTKREFRGKGFAKLTMFSAFKEMVKEGCVPCSTVEVKNYRSVDFHKSLGVKHVSIADYILVKKLDID